MDIPEVFKGLSLDVWYKVLVYLGGIALVLAFFLEVKGISNLQLQMLSGGLFFFGLGEWKNHKTISWIKPPNAYTGGAAVMRRTVREQDVVGILFDLLGIALLVMGVWSLVDSATVLNALQSPIVTPTLVP